MEDLIPILTAAIPIVGTALAAIRRGLARRPKPPSAAPAQAVIINVVNSPGTVVNIQGRE